MRLIYGLFNLFLHLKLVCVVSGQTEASMGFLYEPRYEKTGFLHMRKTKTQTSFGVTAKLIRVSVFTK